ncbi:MAG: MFS transporter [Odoribacter splanchnicus]
MNKKTENKAVSPWQWVPSLYFAQGIPYVVVMSVAVILFKRMGMSNTDIALYTSGLNLPWVIKPLWSPLVDLLKTKRWWIVVMQILVGAGLAGIALTIQGPLAFRYCLAFMWLLAFSSATHDIAADGFYMLGLNEKKQAYFVGIRNTFYRFAVIFGQGILVMFAGGLEQRYAREMPETAAIPQAWSLTFYLLTILFALLFVYHYLFLPHPRRDTCTLPPQQASAGRVFKEFLGTFTSFFQKKHIVSALIFILLYRFAEAQLVKITSPFLLDTPATGGLALSTAEVGFIYGTIGVIALTIGGIVGGIAMARRGLKSCLWTMTIAMNLPNIVYLYLSFARPESIGIISGCVAIEQFGYGFGFTSLTYFMMLFSNGKHQTAHYAICTGFMALGLMLPGMISGWIEESIGYRAFFVWIMLCTIPSFWATHLVRKNLTDNHSDNSSR